jgi:ATP-dependent RNA helicase DDX27
VGEADRKILKAAIKRAAGEDQVRHRTIAAEIVAKWSKKLESLKDDVAEVLREEKEEKQVQNDTINNHWVTDLIGQLRQAEMEVKKGQNMIEHKAEIYSRPARTWFQSGRDRQQSEGGSHTWFTSTLPTNCRFSTKQATVRE